MIATFPQTSVVENDLAGAYVLEPSQSTVGFRVKNLFGLMTVHGRFSRFKAELDIPADGLELARVWGEAETISIETGIGRRDAHLRAKDFLWADEHPQIRYQSSTVRGMPDQPGAYLVEGTLTVRGVTLPLTLEARLRYVDADRIVVEASGVTDRYAFGMTGARGLVPSWVHLEIKATFIRSSGETV
ncbi:MAG TPA: YceI family protein [Chloroflexota bacterium]|nr:YceI family protein [Chloroflexota bacterium]